MALGSEPQTLSSILTLQAAVQQQAYSIVARLNLAKGYQAHRYPDLAVGEAYLALLLVDECLGEAGGEFEQEASDAAREDYGIDDEDELRTTMEGQVRLGIYKVLIENLVSCGNLKQAQEYLVQLDSFQDAEDTTKHDFEERIQNEITSDKEHTSSEDYPEWGLARREVYPWNSYEPDRSTPGCLEELNEQLVTIAPRLEAKIVELPNLVTKDQGKESGVVKQIGLFAKEDLQPGEQILREKSVLTATARLNDAFCDACAARLPTATLGTTVGEDEEPVSCPECASTIFCSQACLDNATTTYHPSLCDRDFDSLAKDAAPKEASHALYALLLLRVLALADTQDKHPLSLPETKYLWGDFLTPTPSLPFNMHYNVILPFTMLEKMDVNIYEATASGKYGVWIFNTVYAKLRGTADARLGPDGKPEIGAVHAMWCLANHDCAPNVRWIWEGEMGFFVREGEQLLRWRPDETEGEAKGIKKGEQILGHYCDVELPVKERREWARGALGGDCMCQRCVWEAANPDSVREVRVAR